MCERHFLVEERETSRDSPKQMGAKREQRFLVVERETSQYSPKHLGNKINHEPPNGGSQLETLDLGPSAAFADLPHPRPIALQVDNSLLVEDQWWGPEAAAGAEGRPISVVRKDSSAGGRASEEPACAPLSVHLPDAVAALSTWRRQLKAGRDHTDRVIRQFIETAIAVAVAHVTSYTFHGIVIDILTLSDFRPTAEAALGARFAYALLASCVWPLLMWLLRGNCTMGETPFRDNLLLLSKCLPMLVAWAWKDVIMQFHNVVDEIWGYAVVAVCLTFVLALLEVIPCIKRAHEAINVGGVADTYLNRILDVPRHLNLALGYAWNSVFSYGLARLQRKLQDDMTKVFVQFLYFILVRAIVVKTTCFWYGEHDVSIFNFKRVRRLEDNHASKNSETEAGKLRKEMCDITGAAGNLIVTSLSFVYGWALSYTTKAFYFW
jgi:hypothetical protein